METRRTITTTPTVLGRALALGLAAAFAAAGALSAQAHGEKGSHEGMEHGMKRSGMHGGHGAMLAHVPAAILRQGELLELSDGQAERLNALKDSLEAVRQAHHGSEGPMHEEMASAFSESGIDVDAYESALRSMADRRVAARVEVARIAQRALQVLDAGQREKFLYGVHLMQRMHRMHQDGHGEMQGGKKMREKHGETDRESMEREGGGR